MTQLIQSSPNLLPAFPREGFRRPCGLPALALLLVVLSAPGCYRATGIQRSQVVAEEIPAVEGERVGGLKSVAGPGDYYLGNDYIHLAVDGTLYGATTRPALAGGWAGGGIVDAGYLALDTSYRRVPVPSDSLERLTPVLNQDPDIQLVFDQYKPVNSADLCSLVMRGHVLDPRNHLAPSGSGIWEADGRVKGLTVVHTISLGVNDRFFTLTTTVTNGSGASLPISNIGDFLSQRGGGYRFNIPATEDAQGHALTGWGVQIPGTSFATPLASSVKAAMVGLSAAEPGAATFDAHVSLGLLPVDADQFLVACDGQDPLTTFRPKVPERLVVGGLKGTGSLEASASMTHQRRLYLLGATSSDGSYYPNQATGIFNFMEKERINLRPQGGQSYLGYVTIALDGTATRQGAVPAELRFERNTGTEAVPIWTLERSEMMEPVENMGSSGVDSGLLVSLPFGTYRVVVQSGSGASARRHVQTLFYDSRDTDNAEVLRPLVLALDPDTGKGNWFSIGYSAFLCPEHDEVTDDQGNVIKSLYSEHTFTTRERNAVYGSLQPLRMTFVGKDVPDPDMKRVRTLAGAFSAMTKGKAIATGYPGLYQFRQGNQAFGTAYVGTPGILSALLKPGTYQVLATHGPLKGVRSLDAVAFDGQTEYDHTFTIFPETLPTSWISFDLPGPSLATTGGLLPVEALASAMVEGVDVVAQTEMDVAVDAAGLYQDFRMEFEQGQAAENLTAIPAGPFVVGARSSELKDFGKATALFTPAPVSARNGGARPSAAWNLAEFLTQAEGKFNIVHHPRAAATADGPAGLFNARSYDPTRTLLEAPNNTWWSATGPASGGKANGAFDAIELLRADGCDPADPTAWFQEFLQVRRDWFSLLGQQAPGAFTKGLGLSSARYTVDTTVGLARTYLKTAVSSQAALEPVLAALRSGAAVASTGPLLDVSVTPPGGASYGPGQLVPGPLATASLTVNLWSSDWTPMDEVRILVNGVQVLQVDASTLTVSAAEPRLRTGQFNVPLPSGRSAWIVVEAGVPLSTRGAYRAGSVWNRTMKGIYPLAVANPIFVDTTGGGYTPPGLPVIPQP